MGNDCDYVHRKATARSPFSAVPASSFQGHFLALNRLAGFKAWRFNPGMLFLSPEKWWGIGGQRAAPHEGIDLCFYSNQKDERLTVQSGMMVPSPYSGSVVGIITDFIGQSVFVRHGNIAKDGAHLVTMFGHVDPEPGVLPQDEINEGQVLSKIADARERHRNVRSHLHISQAWIDDSMPFDAITWENITDERIDLIDPLTVLGLPYVIEDRHS